MVCWLYVGSMLAYIGCMLASGCMLAFVGCMLVVCWLLVVWWVYAGCMLVVCWLYVGCRLAL